MYALYPHAKSDARHDDGTVETDSAEEYGEQRRRAAAGKHDGMPRERRVSLRRRTRPNMATALHLLAT
jgi:hypothetical protein